MNRNIEDFKFCNGISSYVIQEPINKPENAYHVLQLDLDGFETDAQAEARIPEIIQDELPEGIYIVFNNPGKAGSYSVTSLNLFSFEECLEIKERIEEDDDNHRTIGEERGYWISRVSGKGGRSRPEVWKLFSTLSDDSTEKMWSMPHTDLFRKCWNCVGLTSIMPAQHWVYGRIKREKYGTWVLENE